MKFEQRFLLLLLLLIFPLMAEASRYDNKAIRTVNVVLVKPQPGESFDDDAVRSRLKTKTGAYFSEIDFDQDLKLLTEEFYRVDPQIEEVDEKLNITLKIWPKPVIRTITFTGNDTVPTRRLMRQLAVKENSEFDRQGFHAAFRKVQSYYIKHGYFEAQVEYEVKPDDLTNEVDIEICVHEGRAGRIKEIQFTGFTAEEEAEACELIMTQTYFVLTSWFTEKGTFREDMAEADRMILLNYLQNQGYADAQVELRVTEAPQANRIVVEFVATKGERYYTGNQTFSGHTLFTDEQIDQQFAIREGEPFSPEKVRETARNITNLYGRVGYIDTVVLFEPKLAEDRTYTVHYPIQEGKEYRVGMIKIIGNTWTQSKVILHETLLVPGELFNIDKLKATERRLQNIGYFEHVNVYAVQSDQDSLLGENYRDVHIEVEEKGTGSFGFSFGYSTTDKLYGSFNLTERNFNICGITDLFSEGYQALRGGGEYAHFRFNLGQRSTSYYASWTKPYFMDTKWAVGMDAEKSHSRSLSGDYTVDAVGFGLHATYKLNAYLSYGLHYRYRNTDIEVPGNANDLLKQEAKNSGVISAVGTSLVYDSRNHPMAPTSGFYSRLEGEYAGLGGDHHFFSANYLNNYYAPMAKCLTLKIRGDARFIFPLGTSTPINIPIEERFFLGGEHTVRGYRGASIGPRYNKTDPRGGVSSLLGSTELLYQLHDKVGVFGFIDGGTVSLSVFSTGYWASAAGFGFRVQPIESMPPIVFGMGYPINESDDSRIKRFFLSLGGRF